MKEKGKIEFENKIEERNNIKCNKLLEWVNTIDILDEIVVNTFIKEIYLYPNDQIKVVWNFKNPVI
jgi:hypothetical protein